MTIFFYVPLDATQPKTQKPPHVKWSIKCTSICNWHYWDLEARPVFLLPLQVCSPSIPFWLKGELRQELDCVQSLLIFGLPCPVSWYWCKCTVWECLETNGLLHWLWQLCGVWRAGTNFPSYANKNKSRRANKWLIRGRCWANPINANISYPVSFPSWWICCYFYFYLKISVTV